MMAMPACPLVSALMDNYALLKNKQRTLPWRIHQSEAVAKRGRCGWEDCPGKLASKAAYPRSSDTYMRCEECSMRLGKEVFLCNGFNRGSAGELPPALPHHNIKNASTMVIN